MVEGKLKVEKALNTFKCYVNINIFIQQEKMLQSRFQYAR